jgi:hypothetical protein
MGGVDEERWGRERKYIPVRVNGVDDDLQVVVRAENEVRVWRCLPDSLLLC